MRRQLLKSSWNQWRASYRQRLYEFVFWRKHKQAWRSGYGTTGQGIVEVSFEALLRIAELLGLGLVFTLFEAILAGGRYRSLSSRESAFAKTYFKDIKLEAVLLDERANWIAKPLRIAYVAGFVIKTHGRFTQRLLIHELVHVRQFRRWGWAYVAKTLAAQWSGDGYDVPPQFAFSGSVEARTKKGSKPVATFHPALNAEQEARRLEQWVMG